MQKLLAALLLRLVHALYRTFAVVGRARRWLPRSVVLPTHVPAHVGIVVGGQPPLAEPLAALIGYLADVGVMCITVCDAQGELTSGSAELRAALASRGLGTASLLEAGEHAPAAANAAQRCPAVRIIALRTGRDDVTIAARRLCRQVCDGSLSPAAVDETTVEAELRANAGFPEPVRVAPRILFSLLAHGTSPWHPSFAKSPMPPPSIACGRSSCCNAVRKSTWVACCHGTVESRSMHMWAHCMLCARRTYPAFSACLRACGRGMANNFCRPLVLQGARSPQSSVSRVSCKQFGEKMRRLYAFFVPVVVASATDSTLPGPPGNVSVTVWPHHAEVHWRHAEDEGFGLPTHYVVKWQEVDSHEILWHPDWIGVGNELVVLRGLRSSGSYALRIAAVNTQGRAWSEAVVFRTLANVHCSDVEHWQPLLDELDTRRVCAAEHAALRSGTSDDPDARGACAVGWTEYVLAGLAAGGTLVVVLLAVMFDGSFTERPAPNPVLRLESDLSASQFEAATALHRPRPQQLEVEKTEVRTS